MLKWRSERFYDDFSEFSFSSVQVKFCIVACSTHLKKEKTCNGNAMQLRKRSLNALPYVYWNLGYPDNENQSDNRTETIDSNIFKSSQSNVRYKTMKLQLVEQLKLKAVSVSTFALEILCYLTLDFTLTSVKNWLTVFRLERRATHWLDLKIGYLIGWIISCFTHCLYFSLAYFSPFWTRLLM